METKERRKISSLVIGDVHGHYDRLEALLLQEGILDSKVSPYYLGGYPEINKSIHRRRINHDIEVIQVGDLGHFGKEHPTGDEMCYDAAREWIDILLWGNHDRAVVSKAHGFNGYTEPSDGARDAMQRVAGKMFFAVEVHGWLITHAGLHAAFKHQKTYEGFGSRTDPGEIAWFLNEAMQHDSALIDNVSFYRGGRATAGGILWRDVQESIYDGVPQIFGHTVRKKVTPYARGHDQKHWCVDIGDKDNGRLAGIWLPEQRVVEVQVKRQMAD